VNIVELSSGAKKQSAQAPATATTRRRGKKEKENEKKEKKKTDSRRAFVRREKPVSARAGNNDLANSQDPRAPPQQAK